ncbi:MAG: sigma-54 dependent transcriptional regulator [Desulfosarcinaceae bacterium]|nr:sigma-54 dependent transcriptional regulator [Desulfosarcinaceae bacterium]
MNSPARTAVLLIGTNRADSDRLIACLSSAHPRDLAPSPAAAIEQHGRQRYDLIFIDIGYLKTDEQALGRLTRRFPSAGIIVVSSIADLRHTVSALKSGADEYIMSPVAAEEVLYIAQSLQEKQMLTSEIDYLRDQFWEVEAADFIRTNSDRMQAVLRALKSVAPTDSTVLLQGESGTGKGVLASLLHTHSRRRSNQFISVHCGAIPDSLLESELFGHEKGAFTGAAQRQLGKFEIAHKGTLFLDEISTISPAAQIKLLKVLQERQFSRLGSHQVLRTDVRVITATNTDLKTLSQEGRFRADLYYRLNVFPIELPPLRDRLEDIPILVDTILKHLNQHYDKGIRRVDPLVLEAFRSYDWPGNIRELENLVQRAYILESGPILRPESFPAEMLGRHDQIAPIHLEAGQTLAAVRRQGIELIERQYLKDLLARHRGRINTSAAEAGISTRQLNKLMHRYQLRKEDFKLTG